jgi:Ca2+-binding EF-hand superfamily protein
VRPLVAGVLALIGLSRAAAGDPVLLFPAGDAPARLRLEVTVRGKPPDAAWVAFLDKLFDHFDRDGDGFLSPSEAGRVFPLPLPGGGEAAMDFPKLDADRDGKGSRAEFRDFWRAAGFTPVVVVVRAASAETLALGDALVRHLDRDGDGRLSAAELRQTPALLRRLDENEDEVLTTPELLGPARPGEGGRAETRPRGRPDATGRDPPAPDRRTAVVNGTGPGIPAFARGHAAIRSGRILHRHGHGRRLGRWGSGG